MNLSTHMFEEIKKLKLAALIKIDVIILISNAKIYLLGI